MALRWPWATRPGRVVAPESKSGVPAGFIALHAQSEARWTRRDYATLAREGFMRNPIVHRAVRLIGGAASAVPWLLYEGVDEIVEHPLLDLLERPNARQAGATFLEALYGHLLLAGNAYVELVEAGEGARELHLLRPDRVSVVADQAGWPVALDHREASGRRRVPLSDGEGGGALHLTLFHPLDDHYGFPPLEAALMALDTHNAAGRWNKALLDNSARPSGALVYAPKEGGNLSEDQFERLKIELQEGYSGVTKAGRPLLLEGGLDWKAMALSPKDMDFVEAKHSASRDIALAFGVPPMLLGIPGDNTYANYQEANRAFYRLTVLPLVARIARELSAWLGPVFGDGLRLWYDADQVEGLAAERDALWARIGAAGFLTDDEKRAAVGYQPGGFAAKAGFHPDQPRVPAGSGDGGRWTDGGGPEVSRVSSVGSVGTSHDDDTLAMHRARGRDRRKYVVSGEGGQFDVAPNPQADGKAPWYEVSVASSVSQYDQTIGEISQKIGVDPDLVRAIMYVETTHGYYDSLISVFGENASIRPMNVNINFWGDVWGDRATLEVPANNIRAGARLLHGIIQNMKPEASIAEIATLYNDLGATTVSNYGARVQAVYQSRAWENRQ